MTARFHAARPMWVELAVAAWAATILAFAMARREKTSGSQALEQESRGRLARLVQRRPGIQLTDIWKALGVPRSTTRYHLLILERIGQVRAVRNAGTSRYFPTEATAAQSSAISALLVGRIMEFAALLLHHPGWCQQDFIRALGMRRKTIRAYADRLAAQDLLEERRDQYRKRYFPTERLHAILPLLQEPPAAANEPSQLHEAEAIGP